jgi:hypothetical protein
MKYKILIIDDEWEERSVLYDKFAEEISKRKLGLEIIFEYQKEDNKTSLQQKYNQGHYSAIITDAVLTKKWSNIEIRDVVEIIDDNTPIAVMSSRWDATNADQIGHILKKYKCRTFLHWRDIIDQDDFEQDNDRGNTKRENVQKGQIDYAIHSVVSMLTDKENLDIGLKLDPDEDLRIVHISDLHTKYSDAMQIINNQTYTCALKIKKYWKCKPPAFIAFTGDVTDFGSPAQYQMAQQWIEKFCNALCWDKFPSRRILYVPGNHDINLRLAFSSRIDIKDNGQAELTDKTQQAELIKYA